VPADEYARSVTHRVDVERRVKPADPPVQQGGPHVTVEQQISVVTRRRRKTSVEIVRDRRAPQNRGGGREMRVDAAYPRGQRPRDRRVEVNDLRRRMHAGIGTTRCDGANRCVGDDRERALERVLHRTSGRL